MKVRFLTLGLVMMSLFSCTEKSVDQPEEKVSISASLENGRLWKPSDEVLINGATYAISQGEGTSLATIDKVSMASKYCAAYDYGNGSVEGNVLTFNLPSNYTIGHSFSQPMVASNKNTMLSFKYLLGTLRIAFSGEDAVIKKVVLNSLMGEKLAGEASVNLDFSGTPALNFADGASTSLTIEIPNGISTVDGLVDVLFPVGSYNGVLLTAYAQDGNIMSSKSISSFEIKRGEVNQITIEYVPDAEPAVFLSASVEQAADGSKITWSQNSQLYVNGLPTALYEGSGSDMAKFGPITAAQNYYVSSSNASSGAGMSAVVRVEIPSGQLYEKPLSQINPYAGVAEGNSVDLRYIAGVVSVGLKGAHQIKEAELLSKSSLVRLSGNGVINMEVEDFALSLNADAKNNVIMNCGSGVDAEGGISFDFVVPSGEYTDGFSFIATDIKGQVFSVDIPSIKVERNAITDAGSFEWSSESSGDSDLSLKGYANCYMVHAAGNYSFATSKVDNTKISGIVSADWLWATKVGNGSSNELISNIKYENGRVSFSASSSEGNALIAAFDVDGNIVWSWHIWLTDAPQLFDYENNPIYQSGGRTDGFYVMDRNLGAIGVSGDDAFGLFYQWGRKDPFIGDTENEYYNREDQEIIDRGAFARSDDFVIRNTKYSQAKWESVPCTKEVGSVEYATAHPMLFIYAGENSNVANWVEKENVSSDIWWDEDKSLWTPNEKSIYDPCPVGYQVPKNRTFETLKNCGPEWPDNQGVTFTLSEGVTTWFPYQGYRSAHPDEKGALTYTRMSNGQVELWTSHYAVAQFAYSFLVSKPAVLNYDNSDPWANGLNVRCVKAY